MLRSLAGLDALWHTKFVDQFGGVLPLLVAAPPAWWVGAPWRVRFAALALGAEFTAQGFNR